MGGGLGEVGGGPEAEEAAQDAALEGAPLPGHRPLRAPHAAHVLQVPPFFWIEDSQEKGDEDVGVAAEAGRGDEGGGGAAGEAGVLLAAPADQLLCQPAGAPAQPSLGLRQALQ